MSHIISPIDHIELPVSNSAASFKFYSASLAPLGLSCIMNITLQERPTQKNRYGFGNGGYPFIWIHDAKKATAKIHLALKAESRMTVDEFYHAALESGGLDNGAPGIRSHYHSSYNAAYVLDPDGNNIEAVFQG